MSPSKTDSGGCDSDKLAASDEESIYTPTSRRTGLEAPILTLSLVGYLTVRASAATTGSSVEVAAEPVPTSRYVPLAPQRLLDSRTAGAPAPAPGSTLDLQVTGIAGVPSDGATAVTLNVTVTQPGQVGYVQVLPTGSGELGGSSNLNIYRTDQTVSDPVTVPIGAGGKVTLFNVAGGHLIADVQGFFTQAATGAEGRYTASPTRLLDSRDRTGMPPIPPPPGLANPGNIVNCGGSVQLYNSGGTDVIAHIVGCFTGPTAASSAEGLFVPVTPDRLTDTRQAPAHPWPAAARWPWTRTGTQACPHPVSPPSSSTSPQRAPRARATCKSCPPAAPHRGRPRA